MNAASLGLALFIGMLLPFAGPHQHHWETDHRRVFASLASFAVGTLVLCAWWLLTAGFRRKRLVRVPWWAWKWGDRRAFLSPPATALVPRIGPRRADLRGGIRAGDRFRCWLDHFGLLHRASPSIPACGPSAAGWWLEPWVVKPWQQAEAATVAPSVHWVLSVVHASAPDRLPGEIPEGNGCRPCGPCGHPGRPEATACT